MSFPDTTVGEESCILDPRDLAVDPNKLEGLQKAMFAFLLESRGRVSEGVFGRKFKPLMDAAGTHDRLQERSGNTGFTLEISMDLAQRMAEELGQPEDGNLASGVDRYFKVMSDLYGQVDKRFTMKSGQDTVYDMRYATNFGDTRKQAMAVDMADVLRHQQQLAQEARAGFVASSQSFAEAESLWQMRHGLRGGKGFMSHNDIEVERNRVLDLCAELDIDPEEFKGIFMEATSDIYHHSEEGIAIPGLQALEKDDAGVRALDALGDELEKLHFVLTTKNRGVQVLNDIVGGHRYLIREIMRAAKSCQMRV